MYSKDLYNILGIKDAASQEEIKTAFYKVHQSVVSLSWLKLTLFALLVLCNTTRRTIRTESEGVPPGHEQREPQRPEEVCGGDERL